MKNLFLGAFFISFAPVIVRHVEMGPSVSAFYRCINAGFLLLLFSYFIEDRKIRMSRRAFKWTMLMGLLFALDLWAWHQAIRIIGVGVSTLLGNTQVFYLAVIGFVFFKEKFSLKLLGAFGLASFGLYLLLGKQSGFLETLPKEVYQEGVFLGLFTGLLYAAYFLSLRAVTFASNPLILRPLGFASIFSAGFLAIILLGEGISFKVSWQDWAWTVALALIAQVFGWSLISNALRRVPISLSALILLAQPALSTLWGVLFFNETLVPIQYFAIALTLVAIYLGSLIRKLDNPS